MGMKGDDISYSLKTWGFTVIHVPQPASPHQSDLLVEDHVDSMGFNVNGVLSHELKDIFNSGSVWQTTEADTVATAAGRWKIGRRGENRDRHDGWRGQCGDQRRGHIAVQDLANAKKEGQDKDKSKRHYCNVLPNFWNLLWLNLSWDEDHKVPFSTEELCQQEARETQNWIQKTLKKKSKLGMGHLLTT